MNVSAIIISGGRASRMDGADKGLVKLGNKPLIQHVIDRLTPQVNEVLINANRSIDAYKFFNLTILQDENANFIGPLAGFSLGLQHAKNNLILTVPCDTPLLPADLVAQLTKAMTKHNADIVVANSGQNTHPVISLCKKSVLPSLKTYINHGEHKISTWQKKQRYTEVEFTKSDHAFCNINTQKDLIKVEKLLNHA